MYRPYFATLTDLGDYRDHSILHQSTYIFQNAKTTAGVVSHLGRRSSPVCIQERPTKTATVPLTTTALSRTITWTKTASNSRMNVRGGLLRLLIIYAEGVWRNGSAYDSGSRGPRFETRWGHLVFPLGGGINRRC